MHLVLNSSGFEFLPQFLYMLGRPGDWKKPDYVGPISLHIVYYSFLYYRSSCIGVFPSYRSIVIRLWKDLPCFFNAIYCISRAAQHGECLSLTFNTFISHPSKQKEYWVSAFFLGHERIRLSEGDCTVASKGPQALHWSNIAGLRTCLHLSSLRFLKF